MKYFNNFKKIKLQRAREITNKRMNTTQRDKTKKNKEKETVKKEKNKDKIL